MSEPSGHQDSAASARPPEPPDGPEREVLVGWLHFHRGAVAAKASGLTDAQLATSPVTPSTLTILGLVRHLTEMERVYGAWAIGGPGDLMFVYGDYVEGGPEWDFDVEPDMADASLANWRAECAATDRVLAVTRSLEASGAGNGRSVRWNLHKLVGEYARHNGHIDILRERLDGLTGE